MASRIRSPIALFVGFVSLLTATVGGSGAQAAKPTASVMATMALFYLGFFIIAAFLRVRYTNLLWNSASLGPHRFRSTLRARDMIWISGSNIVAIVCTLGLAVPWAMVRLARYRAGHFALETAGSIDDFVAASESRHGAGSAELVDALDMGVDIGL